MKSKTQYCIAYVDENNHGRFVRFSTVEARMKYIRRLPKKQTYATWEHELKER